MSKYTKYVAIDFGTSGCAIALGFAEPDPPGILVYSAWNGVRTGVDVKCPSILLVNPSKEFENFGEEAYKAYSKLSKDDAKKYYYFYRFKMNLYQAPDATMIKAANGKELPAVDVFAMALKFLRDTALGWIKSDDQVKWIVTVPAIWSDAAKEMMRSASNKIGLTRDSTMLVYEPEAAALFSQYDLLRQELTTDYENCYLVVDCGGGTVDIAAHKLIKKGGQNTTITELAPPSGDSCGGFAVNDQFELLLQKIFKISNQNLLQIKEKYSVQWNKIINDNFEKSKFHVDPDKPSSSINIAIPKSICKEIYSLTGKSVEDLLQAFKNKDIEWDDDDDAIVLKYPVPLDLFNPITNKIYLLIKKVLTREDCKSISAVLMVGGFATSNLLYADIKGKLKRDFPNVETYRSSDPTFSVVKGAVLNAQLKTKYLQMKSPSFVTSKLASMSMQSESPSINTDSCEEAMTLPFVVSRKMRYTIGVETSVLFEDGEHNESKKLSQGGETYCTKVFYPLVKANESIHIDAPKKKYLFRPLSEEQSKCDVTIFASEKENVKYIDDMGCQVRAHVEISGLPKYNSDLSREIELCVDFYETECEISAYSVVGNDVKKVTVDYHFQSSKHLPLLSS